MRKRLSILAAGLVFVLGCQKEFNIDSIVQTADPTPDTSYVQMSPPFFGYAGAQDVMVGGDQLLYVADTRAHRVVMLNLAGQVLSARRILRPTALGQDSRRDLLVGGIIISANGDSVGALFRVHLVSAEPDSAHHLEVSRIDTIWKELARPERRFTGMTVFGDNSFAVVRDGPDNSSFIDPDARVMLFDRNDHFVTPIPALTTRAGSGISDMYHPTGIASFPGVKDFILVQSSEGVAYCALWFSYQSNTDFEGWLPRFDPANPTDRAVDFIRPNRYREPQAVAIDPVRRDVFIADAAQDSIYKFNSRGALKAESFGFAGSKKTMFHPTGLAFYSKVLYVLDGETGQILRFRLSSDVPR